MTTPSRERAQEDASRLVEWFRRDGADLPWRRTRDRYPVLVAEAMLQATQVARVVPFYLGFVERWPGAADLAAARLGDVLAAWHGLGYPRRARNLHAAARVVAERGWPEPGRFTDLPGVGRYTAAALRCFADGEDVLPVDTNAARVVARRFPEGWPGAPGRGWEAGQAVMDLGRLWCTARAPRCDAGCPMREGCPAADAGTVAGVTPARRPQGRYEGSMRQRRGRLLQELATRGRASAAADPEAAASLVADGLADRRDGRLAPAGSADMTRPPRVVVAAVIERGGRILVSQRGPGVGQPGRWEFPGGKREEGESDRAALAREVREELGVAIAIGPRIWTVRAGPLELRFYRCAWQGGQRPRPLGSQQFRWVRRADLGTLEFPPADDELVAALADGAI